MSHLIDGLMQAALDEQNMTIDFRAFYDLFMARYLGCYSCEQARLAWQFFDSNRDGTLEWTEFNQWLRWTLHQFPQINECPYALLDTLVNKVVMPDIRRALTKADHTGY